MDYRKAAGIILLFLAFFPVPIWVVSVAVGNPTGVSWEDNFVALLSVEGGLKPWFYASVISVLVSLVAAATYLTRSSQSRNVLLLLLGICLLQALPAIIFLSWDLKIMYSIPVVFGFLAYKNPNTSFQADASRR
jgi:hypothetical protein